MSGLGNISLMQTTGFKRHRMSSNAAGTETDRRRIGRSVPGIYDAYFTSTKLVLLNSRCKPQSDNRLRVATPRQSQGRAKTPDPERHFTPTPVNPALHENCMRKHTARNEYILPKAKIEWANYTERPQMLFSDGSAVNPKHHTSCMLSNDPTLYALNRYSSRQGRPQTARPMTPRNESRSQSAKKRTRMSSMESTYEPSDNARKKRATYIRLVCQEFSKGNYSEEEISKYMNYIESSNKQNAGGSEERARSAPPGKQRGSGNRARSAPPGRDRA